MDHITQLLSASPTLLLIYLLADKFGPRLLDLVFHKPKEKTIEDRVIEALERSAASTAKLSETMGQLQDTLQDHGIVLREISAAVAHLYGYLQIDPPAPPGRRF